MIYATVSGQYQGVLFKMKSQICYLTITIFLYSANIKAAHVFSFLSGEIYLITQTKEESIKELNSLHTLNSLTREDKSKKRLQHSVECLESENTVTQALGGRCYVSVHNILSNSFSNLLNKELTEDGPNCWNASLVILGLEKDIKYTSPEEFSFIINSECQHVTKREDVEVGDIIAIRNTDEGEIHGMVYISPNLVFTKNGYEKKYRYIIDNPDKWYEFYGVKSKECRFQTENNINPKCEKEAWANIYRCTQK